jgi:S1-C subfamily serine protease
MYHATVSVVKETEDDFRPIGAGVVIHCKKGQPKVVVTAWHVVKAIQEDEDAETTSKGFIIVGNRRDYDFTLTRLAAKMEKHDLALLVGAGPEKNDCASVKLAAELPDIGSTVWAIGSPMGKERNVTRGVLSHVYTYEGVQLYRTDAALFFGNSGGPMFNDTGELVGINVSVSVFARPPIIMLIPGGGNAVGLPHIRDLVKSIL